MWPDGSGSWAWPRAAPYRTPRALRVQAQHAPPRRRSHKIPRAQTEKKEEEGKNKTEISNVN